MELMKVDGVWEVMKFGSFGGDEVYEVDGVYEVWEFWFMGFGVDGGRLFRHRYADCRYKKRKSHQHYIKVFFNIHKKHVSLQIEKEM